MRTIIYIITILLFISCGQENNKLNNESKTIENDSIIKTSIAIDNKIQFKKYKKDGMFLKEKIRLFDNNWNNIGKLEIDKISLVEILEKSTKMYNLEGKTDNCEKAYFLKVKYQGKEYTVFGQDIYEINNQQKFTTQNEKNEKLTLFPITNFEMGASDEEGLTLCDDYSLLVLLNENKHLYSLMKYPDNEDLNVHNKCKYAVLFHDDGGEDEIHKLSINHDTLIVGIKSIYQEGGGIFNLKINLSGELHETKIADRILFETDEDLKQIENIK